MMRIIGCGNEDRADDAAGLLVARRLRKMGFDALEHSGDGFALLDLWQGADDVILVDALVSGGEAGQISIWNPDSQADRGPDYRCSTHVFGPAEAIELGRALGRLPGRIRVYGIEASNFEIGSAPSAEVTAAVDRVVCELVARSATARP